jgi:hypothetical protein
MFGNSKADATASELSNEELTREVDRLTTTVESLTCAVDELIGAVQHTKKVDALRDVHLEAARDCIKEDKETGDDE